MNIVNLALRLLRLASNTIFLHELNRFLALFFQGSLRHRKSKLPESESHLLSHIRAPLIRTSISLPNGLQIHTLIVGAAAHTSHPDDRPLVLLHGHSMAAAFFFRNFDDLLDMGYSSVYVPDLPGWGRSSRPIFKGDSEDAVNFFLRPLQQWVHKLRLRSFALCGHSLGAYVAHEYALRNPARVTRLILTSPAAIERHMPFGTAVWFWFSPQRFLIYGGLFAHCIYSLRFPRHPPYDTEGLQEFTLFANSVSHGSGDAAAASLLRFVSTGNGWKAECVRPLLERVKRLSCPVDIITGDRDVLVQVDAVVSLYRRLLAVGNDVRLNIIGGADHSPHICMPARFAKALLRGLA